MSVRSAESARPPDSAEKSSSWSVVREIGLAYEPTAADANGLTLAQPAFIGSLGDGGYVIVDELGLEKNRTVRFECRTLLVDAVGTTLYDSNANGIHDGFGCAMDPGHFALLRRTTWELWILDVSGSVVARLDLCAFSQRTPRMVQWTPRDTFLVSFVDAVYEVDIVELDRDGRLLWYLPKGAARIGCPAGVSLSGGGNLLVADDFQHVALEIDRAGRVAWRFGEPKHPAGDDRHVSSPKSVRPLPGGRRLIADGGNHRILIVDGDRCVGRVEPEDADLVAPSFADSTAGGGFLICDTGNRRVVELDAQGRRLRQWGRTLARQRSFSYPRSIQVRGEHILVADTAHDRVVEVAEGGSETWAVGSEAGLFWPRCARRTESGSVVVADGRNSRIVELGPKGEIRNTLHALDCSECPELRDPHDVRPLPNGRLLIADSASDVVAEVEWSGHVHRLVGPDAPTHLDDPHSVQPIDGGLLLICDSGNSRILWVDGRGQIAGELRSLVSGTHQLRLNRPRYAEITDDGTLLVVDSGNNRVLASDPDGNLLWELSAIPGSPVVHLNQPRWAQLLSRDEVLVSDHSHHRIVHLARRDAAPE
jgi:DNA-binding beta-propeller fold protein YncE